MFSIIKFAVAKLIVAMNIKKLQPHADRQLRRYDCGISVIKTLCSLAGLHYERSKIEDDTNLTAQGLVFDNLKSTIERYGFVSQYKLIDTNINARESFNMVLPCIAMTKSNNGNHFIIVQSVIDDVAIIMDPAEGRYKKIALNQLTESLSNINVVVDDSQVEAVLSGHVDSFFKNNRLDRATPEKIEGLVEAYGKIKYLEYLDNQTGFSTTEKRNNFIQNLFGLSDSKIVPTRFKVFRVKGADLISKAPVVLQISQLPEKAKKNLKKPSESNAGPLIKFFNYVTSFRLLKKQLINYISVGVFVSLFTYLAIYANQVLIDEILPTRNVYTIYAFISILLFARLFEYAISLLNIVQEIDFSESLDRHLYKYFSNNILNIKLDKIKTYSKGDISQRTNELFRIKTVIKRYVNGFFVNLFSVSLTIIITSIYSFQVATIIFCVAAAYWLILRFSSEKIRDLESQRFTEKSSLISKTLQQYEGMEVIKRYSLENRISDENAMGAESFLQVQKRSMYAAQLLGFIPRIIAMIGTAVIILVAAKGHIIYNTFTLGEVFAVIALSEIAFSGMKAILITLFSLQEQSVVIERFFDLNAESHTKTTTLSGNNIHSVEFKNITFSYPKRQFCLRIPFLKLEQGDRICIEGPNGAGKSTFLSIFTQALQHDVNGKVTFLDEQGVILDNNICQRRICMLRAEDIIFNDTLQYNIYFHRRPVSDEAYRLAKLIGADDFINPKACSLDTEIVESGQEYSAGQRRKILILRALLSNADILIFDEVFRGIDYESKQKIFDAFNQFGNDKIIIYISHEDLSGLNLNRTLTFTDGLLTESNNREFHIEQLA